MIELDCEQTVFIAWTLSPGLPCVYLLVLLCWSAGIVTSRGAHPVQQTCKKQERVVIFQQSRTNQTLLFYISATFMFSSLTHTQTHIYTHMPVNILAFHCHTSMQHLLVIKRVVGASCDLLTEQRTR
jgi:hypothetical protein